MARHSSLPSRHALETRRTPGHRRAAADTGTHRAAVPGAAPVRRGTAVTVAGGALSLAGASAAGWVAAMHLPDLVDAVLHGDAAPAARTVTLVALGSPAVDEAPTAELTQVDPAAVAATATSAGNASVAPAAPKPAAGQPAAAAQPAPAPARDNSGQDASAGNDSDGNETDDAASADRGSDGDRSAADDSRSDANEGSDDSASPSNANGAEDNGSDDQSGSSSDSGSGSDSGSSSNSDSAGDSDSNSRSDSSGGSGSSSGSGSNSDSGSKASDSGSSSDSASSSASGSSSGSGSGSDSRTSGGSGATGADSRIAPGPAGPLPTTGGAVAGSLPSELIDTKDWYLTLPTGKEGSPDIVEGSALARYHSQFFQLNPAKNGVVFTAGTGGATTSGSQYPRSELREMFGSQKASWDGRKGRHTMDIVEAITEVPRTKPDVIAGQIHATTDDLMQIHLSGNRLRVKYADGQKFVDLDPNYRLGTMFAVRIESSGGRVKVWYNGQQKADLPISSSTSYFKAGVYTNSNPSKGDKSSEGQVVIRSLSVRHE